MHSNIQVVRKQTEFQPDMWRGKKKTKTKNQLRVAELCFRKHFHLGTAGLLFPSWETKGILSHHLCGFQPSSKLSGNFYFFVNIFFLPFVKINKTLNVSPSFSIMSSHWEFHFEVFSFGCWFLSPLPHFSPYYWEYGPAKSSALVWFWKLKLFCFCKSTGFFPLWFQLNFCVL